jgi:hypothetical protein
MGKRRGKGEARGAHLKAPSVATQAKAKGYSSICKFLRSKGYGLGVEDDGEVKADAEEIIDETPPRDDFREKEPMPETSKSDAKGRPQEEKIEINVTTRKRTLKLTLRTRPATQKSRENQSPVPNGNSWRRQSVFNSPSEMDDPSQSLSFDAEPSTPSVPPSSSPQEPTFALPSPPSLKYTYPLFPHDADQNSYPEQPTAEFNQTYHEYLDTLPTAELESYSYAHLAPLQAEEDTTAALGLYCKDTSPAPATVDNGEDDPSSYPPSTTTIALVLDLEDAHIAQSEHHPSAGWEPSHTRSHTDDSTTLTLCPTFDGMEVTPHNSSSVTSEYDWSRAMMNHSRFSLRGTVKFEDLGPTLVDSTAVNDHTEEFAF